MQDIVAHPETGAPAVVETSYRELEMDQERSKLADLEAQLAQLSTEHEDLSTRKAALETAVSDQKSLIERADAIAPQPVATDTAEGAGGEDTAQPEGQEIPVSVEPQF